jgi:hypothetical protein
VLRATKFLILVLAHLMISVPVAAEPAPRVVLSETRAAVALPVVPRQTPAEIFLQHIHDVHESVPSTLRVVRWCEAGRYINLPYGETNYTALTHGYSGSSGGYQIMQGTWLAYRSKVPGAEQYAIAQHAPFWIQDEVAMAIYDQGRGLQHWRWSKGCWAHYVR